MSMVRTGLDQIKFCDCEHIKIPWAAYLALEQAEMLNPNAVYFCTDVPIDDSEELGTKIMFQGEEFAGGNGGGGGGIPAPGYSHVYVCPDDAVNLHGVYGSSQELKCQFVRIDDSIQTKEPATAIFYTAEVTDLSKWSNEAVEALTNRLASDAVTALTGDSRLSITLLEKYRLLLNIAKGNSATEEYGPRVRPTHYIDVRRR